ncbi:MAG: hypothetical protein J0626_07725 [Rhodospirillaceae bacterium]|nr:hypothetical protein [Rhodospirillaceae bacterium]
MSSWALARLLTVAGWASAALFCVIGAWDFLISGGYKLIILGVLTAMTTSLLALTLRRAHERGGT